MKKLLTLLVLILFLNTLTAQSLLDRIKQKTKDKVNRKVDEKIDKAVDKAVDGTDDAVTGKNKKGSTNSQSESSSPPSKSNSGGNSSNNNSAASNTISEPTSLTSYSKFDFVSGEKLVAAEDFSQDNVGDFPAKWNTNGSGEIVTINNMPGKYLMTQKQLVFYPEWIKNLPDNFTLEFDLLSTTTFSFYSGWFIAGFTTSTNVGNTFNEFSTYGHGTIPNGGGFEMGFHPQNAGGTQGRVLFTSSYNDKEILKNELDQDKFSEPAKTKVHVSVWRQKTRVRVYLDDKKVWDLPRALTEGLKLNSLYFRNDGANNDADAYYVGNIRLAVGAPDTRNKLITEGKFVSHGILFDVNSDKIKPESYGAIKEIATVLQENADVKVKITGHTDADGDDKANMDLSKRRAESVKNAFVSSFGIDAGRLSTEGKGESQPIDSNNSALGKANNRRVEFVKL